MKPRRKGIVINKIEITDGKLTAYSTDNNVVKLTRHQRSTLNDYNYGKQYFIDIRNAFQNEHIVDESDFVIIKNGKQVLPKIKKNNT